MSLLLEQQVISSKDQKSIRNANRAVRAREHESPEPRRHPMRGHEPWTAIAHTVHGRPRRPDDPHRPPRTVLEWGQHVADDDPAHETVCAAVVDEGLRMGGPLQLPRHTLALVSFAVHC